VRETEQCVRESREQPGMRCRLKAERLHPLDEAREVIARCCSMTVRTRRSCAGESCVESIAGARVRAGWVKGSGSASRVCRRRRLPATWCARCAPRSHTPSSSPPP
jgi:hypothetical protein